MDGDERTLRAKKSWKYLLVSYEHFLYWLLFAVLVIVADSRDIRPLLWFHRVVFAGLWSYSIYALIFVFIIHHVLYYSFRSVGEGAFAPKMLWKPIRRVLVVLAVFFAVSSITFGVDSARGKDLKRPIFAYVEGWYEDGGSTFYRGLGYRINYWHQLGDELYTYECGVETFYLWQMSDYDDEPKIELTTIYTEGYEGVKE